MVWRKGKSMMKAIKYGFIFCLIFVIVGFTSCEKIISDNEEGNKRVKEIIGYLESNDAEGLKSLFCEKIQSSKDLDEQIQAALDFFEGEMISYDSKGILVNSGKASGYGNGRRYSYYHISPRVKYIQTTAEKVYEIGFNADIINVDQPDRIGISELRIKDEDDNKCVIGDFYLANHEKNIC